MEKCRQTGKHIYNSEAKANRAKNKYPDIRRYYHCEHCEGWHTTSIGTGLAIEKGLIDRPQKKKTPHPQQITDRLNYLRKQNPKK